jgi:glycosyltransferase involved in cell wall biosynthesis
MLIGDGPLREPLDRLISELGVETRVRLVGAQAEARRFIGAADAVVISSRWEGLPLVALETLAAGSRSLPATSEGTESCCATDTMRS